MIGGSSPDFNTFTEAIDSIKDKEVTGPVTFIVREGTYNEQFIIPEILGISKYNTITFQSESGDSTSVILTHNSTNADSNYIVFLNGVDYITFKNISFQPLNITYGVAILLKNNADHNRYAKSYFYSDYITGDYARNQR